MSDKITKRHVATHAIFGGFTGARVGTRYIYSFEEVQKSRANPFFRFRNKKVKQEYLRFLKGSNL